ncbi:MAG: DUF952 domain-containing protein [Candidatus Dormibacteraeota bacterium]|nr:DUF952 domain-containing protein [Candidatus Dormibacteraeota bacterium]
MATPRGAGSGRAQCRGVRGIRPRGARARGPGCGRRHLKASVFHIAHRDAWLHALISGSYQADSLAAEGFIHCSTAAQVESTLKRHFAGQTDLVLLEIDPGLLRWELRWEPVGGELFPHLYGPLDPAAVISVQTLSN